MCLVLLQSALVLVLLCLRMSLRSECLLHVCRKGNHLISMLVCWGVLWKVGLLWNGVYGWKQGMDRVQYAQYCLFSSCALLCVVFRSLLMRRGFLYSARLPIFSHTEVRWDSVTPLGLRLPEHREGTKKQYRGEKTCWRGREGGSQPKARRSDFRKISKSINAGERRREKGQLFDAHLHCTRRCFQKLKLPIFECDWSVIDPTIMILFINLILWTHRDHISPASDPRADL